MDWFCWENLNRKPMVFYHQICWGFPKEIFPIIQFYEYRVWYIIKDGYYDKHVCYMTFCLYNVCVLASTGVIP